MNVSNNGIVMMLRAMGFDPQEVARKGEELETFAKAFAESVQTKVAHIDQRLTNIEGMLVLLLQRVEQLGSATTPAGETTLMLAVMDPPPNTAEGEEQQHGRRNSRTDSETRRARKSA